MDFFFSCSNYCHSDIRSFSVFLVFYTLIDWNSSERKTCSFSICFAYLFHLIYICIDLWIFILFFVLEYRTIINYFITKIVPALAIGNIFCLASVSFSYEPWLVTVCVFVFVLLLLFGQGRCGYGCALF